MIDLKLFSIDKISDMTFIIRALIIGLLDIDYRFLKCPSFIKNGKNLGLMQTFILKYYSK